MPKYRLKPMNISTMVYITIETLLMVSKENYTILKLMCTGLSFVIRFHSSLTNRTSKTTKNN